MPDLFGIGDAAYLLTGVGSSIWLRQRNVGETGLYLGIRCDSNDAVYAAVTKGIGDVLDA